MNNSDYKIKSGIIETILKTKNTIEDYDFVESTQEYDSLGGISLIFRLLRNDKRKRIEIKFTKGTKGDMFIVRIENYPFTSYKDSLIVSNYIKSRYKIEIDKNFILNFYSGDFQEKFMKFLSFLKEIFLDKMFNIVWSNDWESIPFDWGPYK